MTDSKKLPQCNPGYHYADRPPPGKESDRGWCYKCSAGTFTEGRNRDAQCEHCTVCSAELGRVEEQPCSPSADARCRCDDGFYTAEHGRCRPNSTAAIEYNLTSAVETEEASIPHGSEGSNVKVAITNLRNNIHVKAVAVRPQNSLSIRSATTKFPPLFHSTALHAAATEFGVHNLTAYEAQNFIFFLGNTAVTLPMLSMGNVGFVCIVIMALLTGLWLARRRRKANRNKEVVNISPESDAHVYLDPESVMAANASVPRIDATVSVATANSSKTHNNLDCRSFTPLLLSNSLTFDGRPAHYDVKCSSAFAHVEVNCSIPDHNARHGICNTNGRLGQFAVDSASTEAQRGSQDCGYIYGRNSRASSN